MEGKTRTHDSILFHLAARLLLLLIKSGAKSFVVQRTQDVRWSERDIYSGGFHSFSLFL